LAKYTLAVFRISFARRSSRFSRSSAFSRSRPLVVRRSLRVPASARSLPREAEVARFRQAAGTKVADPDHAPREGDTSAD
jgi:hypothetical protein